MSLRGYNPQIGLTTHLGGKPRWRDEIAAFVPDELPKGMSAAGACGGTFTLASALREGRAAATARCAGVS